MTVATRAKEFRSFIVMDVLEREIAVHLVRKEAAAGV